MVKEGNRRVALVTGASRGIGRAVAERLGRDGYALVLNAQGAEALERVADEIAAGTGAKVATCAGDMGDPATAARLASAAQEAYGGLDVLVNNAGISLRVDGRPPGLEGTPIEHWHRILAVNLTGPFLATQAAAPLMKARGGGRVIFMGSIGTRMVTGNTSLSYASAKAGLLGLARLLAAELGPHGITVNTVAPGRVKTSMSDTYANYRSLDVEYAQRTPVGRIGTPEDIAGAVAYLASPEASFVNGAILDINGGMYLP